MILTQLHITKIAKLRLNSERNKKWNDKVLFNFCFLKKVQVISVEEHHNLLVKTDEDKTF